MGRHAAPTAAGGSAAPERSDVWSPDNPVTDPRLFDSPPPARPTAPDRAPVPRPARVAVLERPAQDTASIRAARAPRPATPPRTVTPSAGPAPHAATPVVAEHVRRIAPRPVAPQSPLVPRIFTPYDRSPSFADGPIDITPRLVAASLVTAPTPILPAALPTVSPVEHVPSSLARRSAALAVCAVAVLGVVSTAAMMLPISRTAAANAESLASRTSSRPMSVPSSSLQRHHHHHHHHHRHADRHIARHHAAAAPQLTESTPAAVRAAQSIAAATPSASASPTASPTSTPPQSATPTPTSTPTQSQSAPSGGGSLLQALSKAGSSAALGTGTFTFNDFSGTIGTDLPNGFSGQGENQTVLEMTPHSSSKGGLVPTATGTTNPLMMLQTSGGSPLLKDFTLQGTDQGHYYNGLRIRNTTNARIENVRVKAIPGNNWVNPGETFGISDFRSTGSSYSGVEIDGGGVGASGLGLNNASGTTVTDSYFHDNPYSAGIAAWQSHDLTLTDVITKNNRTGLNFERVSGTVNIIRPTIEGNSSQDIYVGSDQGSAKITITDPIFTGKLRIRIPSVYWGGPDQQKRSDIRVIINGADRTSSVVEWI